MSLHRRQQVSLDIGWGAGKNQLTSEEREFSEAILAKCCGLPKVIAAIGEYASEKIASRYKTMTSISKEINNDFIGKLETDSRFHSLRGLFCWMQSYFDACSDSLKPCIFYLSIFQNIRRRRMLRRWIAEGYSTDTSASGTAEDNGEMLFAQLVESSIIQEQQTPSSNSNNNSSKMVYQVNGFFLEYIKSRPMEDNLVFALEGHCSPNTERTGQHLAILSSWDRDHIVFESMDFTRLRSLTVFGEWRSFFISTDTKMRLLRVLDLEDITSGVTDDVLEQIGKLLPRLKFLSVRGCKDITCLPDSLGRLRQLQTLDVRHTSIVELSCAIIKLVKLQYLRAGTTSEGHDDNGVPVADEDDCSSIYSQTPATCEDDDSDDASTSQTAASGDGDGASTSQTAASGDGDGANTSQTQTATDSDGGVARKGQTAAAEASTSRKAAADGDDRSTSRPAGAADSDVASTSQQAATDKDVASNKSQPAADKKERRTPNITVAPWRRSARNLVVSFSKRLHRQPRHDDGSVKVVPAAVEGIGKLAALHTLGVVHVSSGAGGKTFLEELKKLTQLRKLGVSGINRENWHALCIAISGHLHHLESLSVRLDKEETPAAAASFFSCSDHIFSDLPKTLKSLKLFVADGNKVHVSPVLLRRLGNLTKFNFELTVSTQLDIDSLAELPCHHIFGHLYVKPIQDGQLCYAPWRPRSWQVLRNARVLEIDCGSHRSEIFLGDWVPTYVELLVVHCSSITAEPSLDLSWLNINNVWKLKEVWLKGSYSEAVKQHLQQKIDDRPSWMTRPVLKLDDDK